MQNYPDNYENVTIFCKNEILYGTILIDIWVIRNPHSLGMCSQWRNMYQGSYNQEIIDLNLVYILYVEMSCPATCSS